VDQRLLSLRRPKFEFGRLQLSLHLCRLALSRRLAVFTVAESMDPVTCNNPLVVMPKYTLENCPPIDILLVPGGQGTRSAINRGELIDWIAARDQESELTTSVCTGSFLLAKAGLLDGKSATTHWGSIQRMRDAFPALTVLEDTRYVDEGAVISSAGVSAGIDMALYILQRLFGTEAADATARYIEYDHWDGSVSQGAELI
jgi:transcriptional regulator GlxA family with amidase domain